MIDGFGRNIHYMRLSVTDRCNLRCRYCMEESPSLFPEEALLDFDALLRLSAIATGLGITRFKITGGEPLVRKGCSDFIRALKALPGVEQVTLTTNGALLPQHLEALLDAGIDGINISLDTLDTAQYRAITRSRGNPGDIVAAARECAKRVRTKINAVALAETAGQVIPLASLAEGDPLDVRFIEAMPIGAGAGEAGQPGLPEILQARWPDLTPTRERRGNGPARYYRSQRLMGRIGLIEALGHRFCKSCNRVRLTGTGILLPCLYHSAGADLKALLDAGASDAQIRQSMENTILCKPEGHFFTPGTEVPGHRKMHQIGG